MQDLSAIESRVAKLENLVGKFDKLEQSKGIETLANVSNKISTLIQNNPKIFLSSKNLNDIKKYTSLDFISEIENESLINSKIDFILSEEQTIRKLQGDFHKLDEMVKILDNKSLNDILTLSEKLKQISAKQANLKSNQESFKEDLNNFLTIYSNSINSINETITCLNDYLDQFDTPLVKKESQDD